MEEPKDFLIPKMNCPDFNTVLSIDLICDCICRVMRLEDLKQFRLVCIKWKDISERSFKKRVRICFDFHRRRSNKFIQHPVPEDLNEFFRASQTTYPFTALGLSRALPWTNSALTQFFSTEGKYITDLKLYEVKWKNDEDAANELKNVEVGNFPFMSIFGGIVNLEKLNIRKNDGKAKRLALTLHDLAQIQYITLKNCIVKLTDCRITPIELTLDDMTFVQGGKILDSVLLNDFVNFTLMEKLTTCAALNLSRLPECKTTKMKLNLYGREKVKFVKVRHCVLRDGVLSYDIVDFRNSSWEIETLDLFSIQFQQTNNMIIRNISMHRTQFSPHHFPQSLQKLCLTDEIEFPDNLQWNFTLPNLKILELTGTDTIITVFPHLLNSFPNLVELKFKSWFGFGRTIIMEIDVNLIPPHVQKIFFHDCLNHFVLVGDGVRAVQTLFLKKANSDFAVKMCDHFVPNNLIVFVEDEKLKLDMEQSLFVALSKICDKGIIFGLFYDEYNWDEKDDEDNFVFPIVDMPGEFYSYINGRSDLIKCEYDATNKSPLKFSQFQSFLNSSDNLGNGK